MYTCVYMYVCVSVHMCADTCVHSLDLNTGIYSAGKAVCCQKSQLRKLRVEMIGSQGVGPKSRVVDVVEPIDLVSTNVVTLYLCCDIAVVGLLLNT